MTTYEYGRIAKLEAALREAGIAEETIGRIMAGGEGVRRSSKPEAKAAWMGEAMRRMDAELDEETRRAVREDCACCLGGKRLATVKGIAKAGGSLEERIKAANEAKLVFGHSVTLQDDGSIVVRFWPEGRPAYRCVCLPKAKEPLPITYCYCCGGHVRHHLQTALGCRLTCQVRSSALSSGGKDTCTFVFQLAE